MGEPVSARARFEALYGAHARSVLAYALRRTAQPADAADVIAETFLVAWRRLDVVPDGDEARLWLYGVARRVMANLRRGERRRDRLGQKLRAALAVQVASDHGEMAGMAALVRDALALLPPGDREVLELTAWEGLTARQIGAVLSVPAATVRSRVHRARRRLRAVLADVEHDDEQAGEAGHEAAAGRALVRDHEGKP